MENSSDPLNNLTRQESREKARAAVRACDMVLDGRPVRYNDMPVTGFLIACQTEKGVVINCYEFTDAAIAALNLEFNRKLVPNFDQLMSLLQRSAQ